MASGLAGDVREAFHALTGLAGSRRKHTRLASSRGDGGDDAVCERQLISGKSTGLWSQLCR